MKQLTILITLIALFGSQVQAQKGATYQLPAIDVVAEKANAIVAKDMPLKYAIATPIKDIYHTEGKSQSGQWNQMFDGSWEYRLRLEAKNATSLNVGMKDFYLPPTAELWVSTDDETVLRGPYDGSYNQKHGFFWMGDVPADHMNIRIMVSEKYKPYLSFNVKNVTRGFYRYWEEPSYLNKSGSCNVDVACPEGDDWEDQISSVGRYTISGPSGSGLCTGQLINNTAQDGTPLFSTADHCGFSSNTGVQVPLSQRESLAASISITWNYQSLSCRTPSSTQSGIQISTAGFNQRQSGTTYLASNPDSDFTLVRLNSQPSENFELEFTGWDRRDIAPDSVVAIHHPQGHAKRISFENDPTSITQYATSVRGAGTHIRVADWDLGTTEGGSSGGGLWNADKLFVGQLHGGAAACGNDEPDWYGRLFVSWDNGDDAQSRMKDWLDPINTGQETLQGTGGCEAPTVDIVNNSSNRVGDLLEFNASVSGGSGGYVYEWDINDDDAIDGKDSSIEARYNHEFVGNLILNVKDSSGCQGSASKAIVVASPKIELQEVVNISENLAQICGNGDSVIDPGEQWSTLLSAKNVGSMNASSVYLALGKNRNAVSGDLNDNYGNKASSCNRLFIDIENTGTLKNWESANFQNFPADDEGSTLIQLGTGFDHYGENITQLRASTNGYFSTSATSNGDDFSNDCPLPASPSQDNQGARIAPMHTDMLGSEFYHQTFTSCPRPADTGGDLACEVFLWKGADYFNNSDSTVENVDIQAILYPETSQWVYQYSGNDLDASRSSTGIQNTNASDGITYACNTTNSINTTEAVCIFNKNNLPSASGADFVTIESPALELGDMSASQTVESTMFFSIARDATCGETFSINHEASVFDEGFNAGENNIFTGTIGNNGQCNVVTTCPVPTESNFIRPRNGLWWNPDRDGNGLDLYTTADGSLVYFFYTGEADGEPIWYLANDNDSNFNQYHNNITTTNYPGDFAVGQGNTSTVGWSNTTFIDDSTAIQVREIDGKLSAEKQYFFQYAGNETPNVHTGLYFAPAENGWGHSVGTLGNARVVISFIYDDQGNPYWTIGSGANDNSEFDIFYNNTFCPSCPKTTTSPQDVGEIQMTLNGQNNGTLNKFKVESVNTNWDKSNLPLQIIIAPEQ